MYLSIILYTYVGFFSVTCVCISVVTFSVMVGEDRTWMPKPDEDRLGWSFGLAVLAGFFASFCTIAMFVYCMLRWYEINYKEAGTSSYPTKSSSYGSGYGGVSRPKHQQGRQPMIPMRDISMVPKVWSTTDCSKLKFNNLNDF